MKGKRRLMGFGLGVFLWGYCKCILLGLEVLSSVNSLFLCLDIVFIFALYIFANEALLKSDFCIIPLVCEFVFALLW